MWYATILFWLLCNLFPQYYHCSLLKKKKLIFLDDDITCCLRRYPTCEQYLNCLDPSLVTLLQNKALCGSHTHHHGPPCCRRRARQNRRCRTWRRPRSDWFRCTAQRTAPSAGGESRPDVPGLPGAPLGWTVCCVDGLSFLGGDEPKSVTAEAPSSLWRNKRCQICFLRNNLE